MQARWKAEQEEIIRLEEEFKRMQLQSAALRDAPAAAAHSPEPSSPPKTPSPVTKPTKTKGAKQQSPAPSPPSAGIIPTAMPAPQILDSVTAPPKAVSPQTTTPQPTRQPQPQAGQTVEEQRAGARTGTAGGTRKVTKILLGPYEIQGKIADGGCATVQAATHTLSGMLVAIKTFVKHREMTTRHFAPLEDIQNEIRVQRLLSIMEHPNVVRLYEVLQTESEIHMILEFCAYGDLHDLIVHHGPPPPDMVYSWFVQMVGAVHHLHGLNVVHRDLKADNFLLNAYNEVMLCDFGEARIIKTQKDPLVSDYYCVFYTPPEKLARRTYSGFGVDIWALGVILYFMTHGRFPFEHENGETLLQLIEEGHFECDPRLPPLLQDLIKNMIVVDVQKRFTIDQVIAHPWVARDGRRRPPAGRTQTPTSLQLRSDVLQLIEKSGLGTQQQAIESLSQQRFDSLYAAYQLLHQRIEADEYAQQQAYQQQRQYEHMHQQSSHEQATPPPAPQ
eukprot:TRINITY_DN7789_c0_g1_i1.p1 TRINITY_DN7789_c0_g1~~TRINITY_DN7789_c0_g1_i1.p1  ORF type:complete len:545 (-),score=123.44 TRINITY_DN7789_c0_g1_i1:32-1537(-)